jgi:predicted ATPase/class 3 adenylate cyclase
MLEISGYSNLETLHHGRRSLVLRGRRTLDATPVVIKTSAARFPSSDDLRRLRHEFALGRAARAGPAEPHVVQYHALEPLGSSLGLVLEDFGAMSLGRYVNGSLLAIGTFIDIALRLARAVQGLHGASLAHLDINPDNVLYNPESGALRLCDLSASLKLGDGSKPTSFRGTPAYASPETTLRTAWNVDARADLYSLGVTLFKLLTGSLPFGGADSLETLHRHAASTPPSPRTLREDVPEAIAEVLLCLIAKNPDQRYRGASGVIADLEACRDRFLTGEGLGRLEIGASDCPHLFASQRRVYGRDAALSELLQAFHHASAGGSACAIVTGEPGVGKTTLVNQLRSPLSARGGQFCVGKFEALTSKVPYAAFSMALRGLTHALLTRPNAELRRWQERLSAAVGSNGQRLIELVPELALLIGPQPPIPTLEPEQAQASFRHVIVSALVALATQETPLLIFLDDVQWADPASLALAAELVADERFKYAMLVCAHRRGEAGEQHALLGKMQAGGALVELCLDALDLEQVEGMLCNATGQEGASLRPLAQLVFRKTGGNPFFVEHFLRVLHVEGLLSFDTATRQWQWDLGACEAQGSTENVVELMSRRIHRLGADARSTLGAASCLGDEFEPETLCRIVDAPRARVEAALAEAMREGLIGPVLGANAASEPPSAYRFHHDQIRQAAYALTPRDERESLHLRIGRTLLSSCSNEAPSRQLFAVLAQLRHGLALVDEPNERRRIAELCLTAGRRAKSANAYAAARDYLGTGITLLGEGAWDETYELALALFQDHAEASYLGGERADLEASTSAVLSHATTLLDRLPAQQLRLSALIARNDLTGAIALAREALAQLGVALPKQPSRAAVALRVLETRWRARNETSDTLANRAPTTDPRVLAAMQFLSAVATPAYLTSPNLFPILICEMMDLTLRHGNSAWSADALLGWAAIQIAGFDAVARGHAMGSAAPRLLEALGAAGRRGRTHVIFNLLIRHWMEPVRDTIEPLRDAVRHSIEHGDLTYASIGAVTLVYNMLLCGRPLAEVEESALDYEKLLHRLGQDRFRQDARRILQLVRCLQGESPASKRLSGELFDEEASLRKSLETGDRAALASLHYERALLLFVRGDAAAALESCALSSQYLDSVLATVYPPLVDFLTSLVELHLLSQASARRGSAGELRQVQRRLARLSRWAKTAPANHAHRVHLVRAELHRVSGNAERAAGEYERAIELAERSGYLHEQAMALEAAARFYATSGRERIAATTALAALNAWSAWGAKAKVSLLEREFATLLTDHRSLGPVRAPESAAALDVESVQKASRAIVSEIRLQHLVRRLLTLAMENSGAQRGIVILNHEGQLRAEAGFDVDSDQAFEVLETRDRTPALDQIASTAIVDYVARTLEPLVVADASQSALFSHDPYVRRARPLSVLCLPLVAQGKLNGIVYLENNRMPGAFRGERIEVLRVLSALAAISLDNARLYEDVAQAHARQLLLTEAQARFIPSEFLRSLKRASIVDVTLGDSIRQEMSILFSDVRGFTSLVESMPAHEHIGFINSYLGHMEPAIIRSGGFVDSYLGDGILALFEGDPDNALHAAVSMSHELVRFNQSRGRVGRAPVEMGVGISTGPLTLGTIGGPGRIKCGVVGDPVNLASRIEALTKRFGSFLLISHETRDRLAAPDAFELRRVDHVRVQGKRVPIVLYEVLDAEPPARRDAKQRTRARFEEALLSYMDGRFDESERLFQACLASAPEDGAARHFVERCREHRTRPPVAWDGVDTLTEK